MRKSSRVEPKPESNRCERCGRCCCAKLVTADGEIVFLPVFCEHYDPETRLCTVYERRFEVNPQCLTVEEGIAAGVFPADCPFVRDLPDYRPPREQCTEEELELYVDAPDED
jgi:hypothetical protein